MAAAAAVTGAAALQAPPANPPRAFKPYGSPPPFDLEAERDSFAVWEERWKIFLALSTIDEVLDAATRKTNQLKSCLSTTMLQAVLSAGLTAAQLGDHDEIIDSQYVSSSQVNQRITGYAASETSAASATSDQIAAPYANQPAY
jgi:hypothetical protein